MRVQTRFWVFLLTVVLLASGAWAQSYSSLSGIVFDSGHGYPNARVQLTNSSIGFRKSVTTDAAGNYSFDNVSPRDGYVITVLDSAGKVLAVDPPFAVTLQPNPRLPRPAIDIARRSTIAGIVMSGGSPATAQRVRLLNRSLNLVRGAVTDASGKFRFEGVSLQTAGYSVVVPNSAGKAVEVKVAFTPRIGVQPPRNLTANIDLGGAVSPLPTAKPPTELTQTPQTQPPTPAAPEAPAPVQAPTVTIMADASPEAAPAPTTTPSTPAADAGPTTAPTSAAPTSTATVEAPAEAPAPATAPVTTSAEPAKSEEVAAAVAANPLPAADEAASLTTTTASSATSAASASAAPAIQNDFEPSMAAVITTEQLRLLPLFNRNFLALGGLIAGVHDVNAGSALQGAAFSISGSPTTSTNFLLDGQDNVASSSNQAIPFQVNDAIQEFRVIYSNPGAEYGQSSGGVVDVVTNRGSSATKAWHGGVFGYFNDDSLNADSPISAYSNTTYAKAAAYAGTTGNSADENHIQAFSGNTRIYDAYAPLTYNALYSLLGTPQIAALFPTAGATPLRAAGAFDTAAVKSQNDSFVEPFSSQQFGGRIGGPLLNSKVFVFASYEGTRINNPNPIFERVPSAADLNSPVSGADAAAAQSVLKLFPAANVTAGTGIFAFYKGTAPNFTHVHNLLFRPDMSLGSLGDLSLRYTGQLLDQLHDDSLPANSPSGYPGNGAERRAQNQSVALVHSKSFGGGRVNVARLGFTQFRLDELAQDRNFDFGAAKVVPATYVLSGVDARLTGATQGVAGAMGGWYDAFWNPRASDPAHSPSPITPSLDGDFPFARIGAPLTAPSVHRDTEGEASDNFSFQIGGRNHFSAGGDYRYQQNLVFDGGTARGLVVSNNIGEFTSDSESCISCGRAFARPSFDYALRQPTGYVGDLRSSSVEGFIEDKFQATPRITVTAGVRYEYFAQPLDTRNQLWNFDPTAAGLVKQGSVGTYDPFSYKCQSATGNPTDLDSIYGANSVSFTSWKCSPGGSFSLPDNKKDVAPRLGIAFAPGADYRTVVRAAAGLYYDHLPAAYNEQLLINRPTPLSVTNPSAIYGQNFFSGACGHEQCGFGLTTLSPGAANYQPQYQAASGAGPLFERDIKNLKDPYSVQLSASVQQQFSNNWTGEVAYTGNLGRHLPLIYDSNYTNEFYCNKDGVCDNNTFFPVFTESNIGNSGYHSMVVRVRGEAWKGLTVHGAYTWSKSLDDVAGSLFPQSTDSLWNQLFGRQLYGLGNPIAFALGANSIFPPGQDGGRGAELLSKNCTGVNDDNCLRKKLLTSATIPSFNSISSALTTTGSRQVTVSEYSLPQNPIGFQKDDRGRSNFDVSHRAVVDAVYAVPDLFGNKWLGGFAVSGVLVAQTGQPYTVFSGPAYGQVTQRVNVTGKVYTTGKPGRYFANTSAFTLPSKQNAGCNVFAYPQLYAGAPGGGACLGNSARNAYTGPSYISQDFAIQKATKTFGDNQAVVVRAEFYNLFNRANYYNPISQFSTDGVHQNPEFGLIRSAHDPLQVQFAVRYDF